jgi:hypothetical protein
MHGLAQRADVRSSFCSAAEQLLSGERSSCGTVFVLDAMAAALLPQVLAQQLPSAGID